MLHMILSYIFHLLLGIGLSVFVYNACLFFYSLGTGKETSIAALCKIKSAPSKVDKQAIEAGVFPRYNHLLKQKKSFQILKE